MLDDSENEIIAVLPLVMIITIIIKYCIFSLLLYRKSRLNFVMLALHSR